MIKTIIFDMDGVVIQRDKIFSERFTREFNVPMDAMLPFFQNEFQLCLVGKADLKEELTKYLEVWNWKKSAEDLLTYWFTEESYVDQNMVKHIHGLRQKGIHCSLATNNELYRARYLFETVGLKNSFDATFASGTLLCKKPDQEFWSTIHARLGSPNKSTVLVWDDSLENVASAKEFGFHAEFYSDFPSYEKVMRKHLG